ncbi:hypothetical protein ACI3KX_21655, partial [Microbacterium sp. ZW CA_36]
MGLRGKTGAPHGGPSRPYDEHDDLEEERAREAALAGLFGPLRVGEREQPIAVAAASARVMAHHGAAAASVPATAPTVAALMSVPPARVPVPAPAPAPAAARAVAPAAAPTVAASSEAQIVRPAKPAAAVAAASETPIAGPAKPAPAPVPAVVMSPDAQIVRPAKPAPPLPPTIVAATPPGIAAAIAVPAEIGGDSLATGGPAASAPGSGDSPRALAAMGPGGPAPAPVDDQVVPPRAAPLGAAPVVEAQRTAPPNTAATAPGTRRPGRRSAAARWGLVAASVIVVGALATAGTVTVQSAMARDRLAAAVAQLDEAEAGVVAAQADLDAAIVEDATLGAAGDAGVAATEPVLAQLGGISDDAALQAAQVAFDDLNADAGASPVAGPDTSVRTGADTTDVEAVTAATDDADDFRADLVAAASDVRAESAALQGRIDALHAALLALGATLPTSAD